MHGANGYSNNDPANATWRPKQLHQKIEDHRDDIVLTQSYYTGDMDVLIVALGATTRSGRAAALEARTRGIRAGVLQLQTVWPFPDREIAALAKNVRMVVVPEMNYSGQVAGEVQRRSGAAPISAGSTNTTAPLSRPRTFWTSSSRQPVRTAKGASHVPRNRTQIPETGCPAAHVVLGLRHRRHAGRPAARFRGVGLRQYRYRSGYRHRLHRKSRRLSAHQCPAYHPWARARLRDRHQGYKPSLKVVAIMGDGDSVTIGGNHFIHAARRNIDLTAIVLNNLNYGMTGGQVSGTTPEWALYQHHDVRQSGARIRHLRPG